MNDDDDVNVPSCCCGINKLTHIYYTYKVNTTRNTVCFIKHIFLIVLKTYLHIVIHIYKPSENRKNCSQYKIDNSN